MLYTGSRASHRRFTMGAHSKRKEHHQRSMGQLDDFKGGLCSRFENALGTEFAEERRVAIESAVDAGELLMAHFREPQLVKYKSGKDFTTAMDSRAETCIKTGIAQRFPQHGFLGEEQGSSGQTLHQWIIDPIDGTFNYAFGLPFFTVSIALVHRAEPLVGVVYAPYYRELFFAQLGGGTWLNEEPVRVSDREQLGDAMICMDFSYDVDERIVSLERMKRLIPHIRSFRVLGSAALGLAYVACGRMDAFFHQELKPWDWAAADLLVREAGGRVSDMCGGAQTLEGSSQEVVASNGLLHDSFIELLSPTE